MRISDIEYQPRAHRIIRQAIVGGRMPHAYLFAGPDGVGKEMFALALAQTLLCSGSASTRAGTAAQSEAEAPAVRQDVSAARPPLARGGQGGVLVSATNMPADSAPSDDPAALNACGQCQDCQLVQAGTHPDLFLVYRQLAKQHPDADVRRRLATQISVDVIRHFLIAPAGHRPVRGRAKVFIVREAERISDQAQNALLKTLEEPPPDTFLILLAPSLDRMLPTTRSRCQHVLFSALPADFVGARLRALRPDTDAAALTYAARHSGGSLGQALRTLDDGRYALKRAWGQRLAELAAAGPGFAAHTLAAPFEADAKALAKLLGERDPDISDTDATRAGVRMLLAVLADFQVDALRSAQGANLAPINADQPEVIAALTRQGPGVPAAALREIQTAEANLARNANIQLTLEGLFIHLAR